MRYLLFLLLFSCCWGYGQVKLSADQRSILELELHGRKNSAGAIRDVGDSLIVVSKIIPYQSGLKEIKSIASLSGQSTPKEIDEIFGDFPDELFKVPEHPEKWVLSDFSSRIITLYDYDAPKKRKYLSIFNILSISVPIIRNDKKYALIQTSTQHEGGVLHIYKNTGKGWVLYKNLQLYLI